MDQHIPNEKELIRPRRLCLRRELPEPGAHNFACGANYHIPVWFNYALPLVTRHGSRRVNSEEDTGTNPSNILHITRRTKPIIQLWRFVSVFQ